MMNSVRGAVLAATAGLALSASATELETDEQKIAYMIGMDIGTTLKKQGTPLDLDALFDAIRASYEGTETAMTDAEAATLRQEFLAQRQADAAAAQRAAAEQNRAETEAFLAENAQKEGVQVTDSGLQYQVHQMGDGPRPQPTDTVTVHYRGALLDGTEFDSSYSRNEPTSFVLNRVIPGWTEGVGLMPVGSKFTFYIKPELGYGESGGGPIPPNAALVFDVELLSIDTPEE